ncbi:MAG TPA: hypothetical protein VGK73_08260, partial [Polyangiaceae bacterium]
MSPASAPRRLVRTLALAPFGALVLFAASPASAQEQPERAPDPAADTAPSKPSSTEPEKAKDPADDGWPDMSGFLDEKYGFLPIVMPITEPAVGYGAAGGLLFITKPLGAA